MYSKICFDTELITSASALPTLPVHFRYPRSTDSRMQIISVSMYMDHLGSPVILYCFINHDPRVKGYILYIIQGYSMSGLWCYVNFDPTISTFLPAVICWSAAQRWAHPLPDGPVTTQPHNVAHNVAVTTQPHPECPGSGPVNPIWEPEKNWDRGGEQNLKVEHEDGKLPLHIHQPHHTWALSRSTQIYRSPPNSDEKFEYALQSQSPASVCENLELWKDKYLFPKLQLFNFNNSGWMHIMITWLAVKQAQARPRLAKAACQPITERWRDALSSTANRQQTQGVPIDKYTKTIKSNPSPRSWDPLTTAVKSNALAELMNRASKIHWKNLSWL